MAIQTAKIGLVALGLALLTGCQAAGPMTKIPYVSQWLENSTVVFERVFSDDDNRLTFALGSADLDEATARPLLTPFVEGIQEVENGFIIVEGYTDTTGSAAVNDRLSRQRAKAVKRVLVGMGVDPVQVKALGHGERNPIADNVSPEGRAKNRRVEVALVKS